MKDYEKKRKAEAAALHRPANTSPPGKLRRDLSQTSMNLSDLGPTDALGDPIGDLLDLNKARKGSKEAKKLTDSNPSPAVRENNSGKKKIEK